MPIPLGSGPDDRSSNLRSCAANSSIGWTLIRKTSLSSDRSDGTAVKQCRHSARRDRIAARLSSRATSITIRCSEMRASVRDLRHERRSERSYLFTMSDITRPRIGLCGCTTAAELFFDGRARSRAPRETGGARRDRTDDLLLAKQALSQLSYGPGESAHRIDVATPIRRTR